MGNKQQSEAKQDDGLDCGAPVCANDNTSLGRFDREFADEWADRFVGDRRREAARESFKELSALKRKPAAKPRQRK